MTGVFADMLALLVPLRMEELRTTNAEHLQDHLKKMTCAGHKTGTPCQGAVDIIACHSDDLQYGGRHRPDARRALVDSLAVAALLTPGGVHTSGLGHWCARPHDGCVNPAGRPTVIRPVVDPTPTVKRRRRLVVDVQLPEVDAS